MLTDTGCVKLIDFGLCCDISQGPKRRMAGTPGWIAPEILRNEPYSWQIDIWSLGLNVMAMAGIPVNLSNLKVTFHN